DVEITGRRAIGAGLALIGNANTGLRIDARRNAYLDRARPLHPAASSAFRTLLADHLSGTLTLGTGARYRKEALLIMQLAPAFAGFASHHAGAGLSSRALTGIAKFLPRQANLSANAGGRFFKRQFHI